MIKIYNGSVEQNTQPHRHRVHEFIVGSSAPCYLCTEQERFIFDEDQTVLVPAGEYHSYELIENSSKVELTILCFDNQVLEMHSPPGIQASLYLLLGKGISTATIDKNTVWENAALTKMLRNANNDNRPYSQEKALNLLGTLLVTHLAYSANPTNIPLSGNLRKIQGLIVWLNKNLAEDIDLDVAAMKTHMSRSSFTRNFKKYTGMSFTEYLTRSRLKLSSDLLACDELSVREVVAKSGFNNLGHFYNLFQNQFGMTPSQFRKMSNEMIFPGTANSRD